jgi:lysophospholipase L1-like esterase
MISRQASLLLTFTTVIAVLSGCASKGPPVIKVDDYHGRKVKVACVGDSITFGAEVEEREKNNYPQVLGQYLGSSFEVRNFGRSGATLLQSGDLPYWKTDEFKAATDWQPDAVIIKLGTNDTKPQNWKGPAPFAADARALVEHFRSLKSKPRIWICLPVPVYETKWGINAKALDEGVIPALMEVSSKQKVPVIDLNDALTNHPEMFPDKIHPNAAGAALMAKTVYQAIRP